nr:carbohydrate-binding family 9-like protein [uncultured Carboxylicivirga sp.]
MKKLLIILFLAATIGLQAQYFNFIEPEQYLCFKIDHDFTIDGNINKTEWQKADWTHLFVDIEGRNFKKPYYNTRAKMLWSDQYLYFAFELKDHHIWANITQKDAVIFHDNDIELFIDANGDTHNYLELELNALNTVWDLFLTKPYREGSPVLNEFDFVGLQTAVQINGTLNNPHDEDDSWTVEVAIPWSNLVTTFTHRRLPHHGENMRMNFSRVQWETQVIDGKYEKVRNPETGKPVPENNWIWSPMGVIDMHRPELWGIVTFVDQPINQSFFNKDEEILRQLLLHIYKAQRSEYRKSGNYLQTVDQFNITNELLEKYNIHMDVLEYSFEIKGSTPDNKVSYYCNTEGRLVKIQ